MNEPYLIHNHTDASNFRLRDAVNKPETLLDYAVELGLPGIAITDHATISNHVRATRYINDNPEKFKDFKLGLGDEFYLLDKSTVEEARKNNEKIQFHHFLALAKNQHGYEFIKKLTTREWENSFHFRGMERTPTYFDDLKELIKGYEDDVIFSSACFTKGQKVKTKKGYKNIEDIETNDIVLTEDGTYQQVIKPTSRNYEGDFIELDIANSILPIESTDNHKFLTLSDKYWVGNDKINQSIYDSIKTEKRFAKDLSKNKRTAILQRAKQRASYEYPEWIEAKDLKENNYLLTPIDYTKQDVEVLKYGDIEYKIDKDFLYVLGLFIGDGHFGYSPYDFGFTLNYNDKEKTEFILKYFKSKGLNATVRHREEFTRSDITVFGKDNRDFWDWLFKNKKGALNKHIPNVVKNLPTDKLKWLLKGLAHSDGYFRKEPRNEFVYASISYDLIQDIKEIFFKFSINPAITSTEEKTSKDGTHHQKAYYISVGGNKAEKFKQFCNNNEDFILEDEDLSFNDIPVVVDGVSYMKNRIKNISKINKKETVHCMKVNKNHSFVIEGATVHNCLGSPLSQLILQYHEDKSKQTKKEIHEFIKYFVDMVGKDNFYLELQPAIKQDGSNSDVKQEQQIVNDMLLQLSKVYGLTPIITTDAHYLNKEQAFAHKTYLQASNGDREVESFYSTTYVMDREELLEYFDKELLDTLIENTHELMNKIEPIKFEQQTQVPNIDIPKYTDRDLFKNYVDKYPYIDKYRNSKREMDRYYLHLIGEGMELHNQEFNETNLSRIEIELEQVWEISEKLDQALSSYFVLTQDVVKMMWEVSLVGVSRGSASCFYTNYLLEIVQINAIKYKLPYWRFLNKDRPELADIDLDSQASKREEIMDLARERYGSDKILNSCTFTTEGPKSTVITATRGYGLDISEQHNISNLIPSEGALLWSVSDCFFGNEKKGRKPVQEFIDRVERHEGLKDVMLSIEGIISGRSQHASSVIFYPGHFLDANAMMKTTKKLPVTQFNAEDGVYAGELKLDFLSISALDTIRESMELLLKDGKIEWQGSLKATYDKYFHPDVLDLTSKEMFDMLADGDIFDAFQMSSLVAKNAMKKIRPETFNEIEVTNTLIRLQVDGGKEQPVDKFVRYKNNINEWYKDMENYGLNKEEIKLMKEHLLERNGIMDTQEAIMLAVMDKRIGNSDLLFANKYRKAIAKKNEKAIEECEEIFTKNIINNGHSREFADYIINEQIGLSRKYSFSRPHVSGYSLILMIEMNIGFRYGLEYWKTACLNDALFSGDEISGSKDFTAVSEYVNALHDSVLLPDINKSELKFTTKNDKVLFGLGAILGMDTNTLDAILEHRPFISLEDYYNRMVETKLISPKKSIMLIKSGAMDNLENMNRRHIMAELVKYIIPQKEKTTMVQLPYVRNILPNSFSDLLSLYDFRNRIEGRNKEKMNEEIEKIFISNYSKKVEYEFNDGQLEIDMKSWKKFYDKAIKPLKEEIKKDEYAKEFTKQKRKEYWLSECSGTIPEWEIETILFNSDNFIIDNNKVNERFKLSNFNKLKNNPILGKNNRGFVDYEISAISGVVVGNNHVKRIVYLLTENSGVVPVKVSRKNYTIYQEKTTNDGSWWDRGNLLVVLGYKSGASFNMRGNNIYRKPVIKIEKIKGEYNYRNEKR